jgi:3-oxoacyl-[acyl-carrier protein] reductase
MTDALTDDQKSEILNQIPIRKFGDPKNIAELAVFLASEKGQYITGQTISVDGGLYMI